MCPATGTPVRYSNIAFALEELYVKWYVEKLYAVDDAVSVS